MLRKQGCTIDQVLEQIGSFELYQIRLLLILSYLQWFPIGFQILAMTFIAAEPNWRCVTNSTECTESGTFAPGHKYYAQRCNMNRSQWKFTTELTSITTEVSYLIHYIFILMFYIIHVINFKILFIPFICLHCFVGCRFTPRVLSLARLLVP